MARKSQRLRRQKRIERMKAREQEAKMTKVVEDNSVVLERMKNVSSTCDSILQTINNIKTTEPTSTAIIEPQFLSTEPVPELEEESEPQFMTIQPAPELGTAPRTNLSKMRKKELLELASDLNLNLKPSTTKANIIKAIESV